MSQAGRVNRRSYGTRFYNTVAKKLILGAVVVAWMGGLAAASADAHCHWFMSQRRFYGPAHGGFAYPNARFNHVNGMCCATWCGGCGYYCWANGECCGGGGCGACGCAPCGCGPCGGGSYFETEVEGELPKTFGPPSGPMPRLESEIPTTPAPPAPDKSADRTAPRDAVLMDVFVPSDARVFINGAPTSLVGNERLFRSGGLENGRAYGYELRAELVRNGQTLVETRTISAKAGETVPVAFSFSQTDMVAEAEPLPTRTTLRLHVPEDAQVFLDGSPTTTTGAVRTYATSSIVAGERYASYDVRVEVQRNGQKLVEEKSVTIEAGHTHELTIDITDPRTTSKDNGLALNRPR